MQRKDAASVLDMIEAARSIVAFIGTSSLDDYLANELLRAGVERKIEIIGEAARRVSPEFKQATPHVPLQIIIAQRNILAHDYDMLVNEKIYRVATIHAPALVEALVPLLPPPPTDILPES